MKENDRYIITLPALKVERMRVADDGTPTLEAFAEMGGARYPGDTYSTIVALEQIYAEVAARLVELAELGRVPEQPKQGPKG